MLHAKKSEEENLSGVSEAADGDFTKIEDESDDMCMILAETKLRSQEREIHTDSSSGTYNLDSDDASRGEELEMIAVSRKPFRQLSCSSNIRTNLMGES